MTDQEVNKIIADFDDGWNLRNNPVTGRWFLQSDNDEIKRLYTESIDSNISVWEKLGASTHLLFSTSKKGMVCVYIHRQDEESLYSYSKTIQQAAAHATTKAILELKEKDK